MKRFYLAAPTKYEDQVIEALGQLGAAQLITDYTINGFKRVDTVEKCERYVKLQQRMSSILSTLPRQKEAKKGHFRPVRSSPVTPVRPEIEAPKVSLDQIESRVLETEGRLDDQLGKLEKLRAEMKALKSLDDNLLILQKHALQADELGDFANIFVKGGFVNKALSPKLDRYVEGTDVKFSKWPERREEDFVVVLGPIRDKAHMEEILTRLNFAELAIPEGTMADPTQALEHNRASEAALQSNIDDLERDVRGICEAFQEGAVGYDPLVRRALAIENARSAFGRTETLSLVHGWVPAEQEEALTNAATACTNGATLIKFDNPAPDETPPVRVSHRGIPGSFELFTKLRGLPEYGEIDPTLIVTVLFTIMYGMMFGDMGQGAVLLVIGLIFSRLQRGLLGIPARGIRKLGGVLATCGASAMFFGAMYGEFFLSEAFHPLVLNPIQGQITMIIVALLFGVAQLTVGLVLKIINMLRKKARIEALFGGVKLLYYGTGVVLAVKYTERMSFSVFTDNLWLTGLALACLLVVFLSPTIETALKSEFNLSEGIMKGVSEFIETLLSYLSNSISYVRLAAFAIAHSALGIAAVILGSMMGIVPGFIVMNALALTIEPLGVFVQCMRLTYYEFFTKFYSGTGVPYRPFSLPRVFATIK
jgi:vacuolar-type H+-ATPase subunit I/STV1